MVRRLRFGKSTTKTLYRINERQIICYLALSNMKFNTEMSTKERIQVQNLMMFNPKYWWVLDDFKSVGKHFFSLILLIGGIYILMLYYHMAYVKYSIKDHYYLVENFDNIYTIPARLMKFSSYTFWLSRGCISKLISTLPFHKFWSGLIC